MRNAVLVTGGAGFIGSNLIKLLLSEKNRVVCLDNFDPFYEEKIKRQNIRAFLQDKNFLFVQGDVRSQATLKKIFETHEIKRVVHLAARPGVSASVKKPELYEAINAGGTLAVLEASCAFNVENFVFASSSSVYGATKDIPFREDGETIPISPYGASKLSAESHCRLFNESQGLNIACLRFFTVYGPRQRPDMAVRKFTERICAGKPIRLYNGGNVKRDFTFVSDAAEAIVLALNKQLGFEIINISSANPIELNRLVSLIEKELGKKAKVEFRQLPKSELEITFADISKARRLLGFEPKVPIEEGIKQFVSWYKDTVK